MPVDSTHPEYDNNVENWKLIRDVVLSNVKHYIMTIDPNDPRRSKQYRDDAQFTNFTGRTKSGLIGAIFKRSPYVDLSPELDYLLTNASGNGLTLNQLLQEAAGEVLQCGRYGILVDFIPNDKSLTKAEQLEANAMPRMYRYVAESIINWRTQVIHGREQLVLVVLKECLLEPSEDDPFKLEEREQFRVLTLQDGAYYQAVYYTKDSDVPDEVYQPLDANGNPLNEIPFVFIGSEDNDSKVDEAPLLDLAKLNIGHLKNSADYEESVHLCGQPTMFVTSDMSVEQFTDAHPNGIIVGARKAHLLGSQGKAEYLQASANQLADEAMKRKEEQAIMLGAKLITPGIDRETATGAIIRHSSETSVLNTLSLNIELAFTKAIGYLRQFLIGVNTTDNVVITLNRDYLASVVDPQVLTAQMQLFDRQLITVDEIRNYLKQKELL